MVTAPMVAPDGDTMMSIGRGRTDSDSQSLTQRQSVESAVCPRHASTAFPISSTESKDSVKTLRTVRTRPPTPAKVRSRSASSSSASNRHRPRSTTEPDVLVTPAAAADENENIETRGTSTESDSSSSSPSSSENELQSPATDDSSRTTLTSSCSSSCIGSGSDSTSSSMRTRATSTSSPCVTFAPLPEIGPRQRKSSRPLGLAARGQILRQRRMMMEQDKFSYYDESINSIPGGEKVGGRAKEGKDRSRSDDIDETEVAIAALGKMLGDATRVLWQRVANTKSKNSNDAPNSQSSSSKPTSSHKPTKPTRGFTWPGRLRSKSSFPKSSSGHDSDDDSESDVEGPWSRRRDEDPMTKTIMEGSDDGLDEFVLAYDTIPVCEEEEEELAAARANEELRTTVEVHLVKATEGESED